MVASTRSTASMAHRRRTLSTIFDSVAARHANTPATPPAAQPAANSAGATFLASVRTLQREHFDMKVAKHVQRKLFDGKEGRFSGAEPHAAAIFTRMVSALQAAFVTEDTGFLPLFTLDDATLAVRVEANNLLFSTIELLIDPSSPAADWLDSSHASFPADGKRVLLEFARRMIPVGDTFQGQADMFAVRITAGVDPHGPIEDFNAALKAARTRSTLRDEDVKSLFIKALDATFYQPVVSRLLLHDQRAAHDLLTIQQWVRECYGEHVRAGTATASAHRYSHGTHFNMEKGVDESGAASEIADLRTMVLDLKRQLATFLVTAESEPSPRGFTPRADKQDRRVKTRFAASPLPKGGNWSQSVSRKVAFHRDSGATIPYCQNQVCAKGKARHWDCPNGGRTGLSAYAFAEEAENSVLAARFQHAIDNGDPVEFDALCMLAGGKPEVFTDLSACSFCVEDGEALVSAVTEFSEMARTAGTTTFHVNTFTADLPVVSEPPAHSPPASVESEEEWTVKISKIYMKFLIFMIFPYLKLEKFACGGQFSRRAGLAETGPERFATAGRKIFWKIYALPPNPFCPPVTRTFADFIGSTGVVLVPDEPVPSMNLLSAIGEPERVVEYKPATYVACDDDDEDASVELPRPRYGCGSSIPRFGRSLLTSSLVCALFVVCAAAAPHAVAGVGGAGARTCTGPPVGGATSTGSTVPAAEASPTDVVRDMPCAVPPRRQRREQRRQGLYMAPMPWHPGPPPPAELFVDGPPLSPASSSDDEAPPSGSTWQHPGAVQPPVIENSSISSTNDSSPAPGADNCFTVTLLRAGQTAPKTTSG
ncbi:hypothetical protein CYMTET_50246 [Cymbomonas tetramitiformis]|uniref:Uncharacterized protein n=1 Tax=Cymbomonas tetramitiformis TaxID=36881 RepID=A0AAE0BPT1_9CHLO|nr:hypothetical protein CYMTET_50246 [Cymbomonas tetramitiformis]